MDDARTQQTLNQLADLYLTMPKSDAASQAQQGKLSNSSAGAFQQPQKSAVPLGWNVAGDDLPANANALANFNFAEPSINVGTATAGTGSAIKPPFRLPPKLKINTSSSSTSFSPSYPTAESANAASATVTAKSTMATGPARPWQEVRQERRQAQPATASNFLDETIKAPTPTAQTAEASPQISSQTFGVQAVFLGNLPGFAAPWLTQYAQLLTLGNKRVVVIHLTNDFIDVELVSPLNAPPLKKAQADESFYDLLDRLTVAKKKSVTSWLIHLPTPLSEAARAVARELKHWTLLTGADEAAVSAGCQWVKNMLQADANATSHHLRLAVMGASMQKWTPTLQAMQQAAGTKLEHPLQLAPGQKQIAPVNTQHLGRFAPTAELLPELCIYLEGLKEGVNTGDIADDTADSSQTADAFFTDEQTETFTLPDYRRTAPASRLGPAKRKAAEPAPATGVGGVFSTAKSDEIPQQLEATGNACEYANTAASTKLEEDTKNTPDSAAKESAPKKIGLDLASLLADGTAGAANGVVGKVVALEAKCPAHPTIQLALDRNGRLHLMAQTGLSLPQAITELLQTQKWAKEHLQLLQLTHRQDTFATDAAPQLHLFTDKAADAVQLAAGMGDLIKFHLLQPARIGTQTTWLAAALN